MGTEWNSTVMLFVSPGLNRNAVADEMENAGLFGIDAKRESDTDPVLVTDITTDFDPAQLETYPKVIDALESAMCDESRCASNERVTDGRCGSSLPIVKIVEIFPTKFPLAQT